MRVLVCGGRDYKDVNKVRNTLDAVLDKYGDDLVIVVGACKTGADCFALDWAIDSGVDFMGFPAKWKKHGLTAGPIRNKRMRDTLKPDACIAFGGGKGTKGMCRLMEEVGVVPWVHK